jgi:hypothetical protein
LLRLYIAGDLNDLSSAGKFKVHLRTKGLRKDQNVAILDMTAIFSKMDRDAIGSAEFSQNSRSHRIGFDGSACLTHRGYVIDIYAQFNHAHTVC